MRKIILILLLFLGFNSNAQQNQRILPDLYIEFQANKGVEYMSKFYANGDVNDVSFVFRSLLLGNSNLADTAGVALELRQIEGTTAVTIPLANLATYMAGRPLLNTVQIRQEYGALTSTLQRVAYFNDEERNIFVVERFSGNQTAKITQVWWTNATF